MNDALRLVLQGNGPIEELKALAVKYFSAIPDFPTQPITFPSTHPR